MQGMVADYTAINRAVKSAGKQESGHIDTWTCYPDGVMLCALLRMDIPRP
jgi:hypothetical protein